MKRLPDIEQKYNIKLIAGDREKNPRKQKTWIMACGHQYVATYRSIVRRVEDGETELLCRSCIHKKKNKKLGLEQAQKIVQELDGELLANEWINNKTEYKFKSNKCGHTWKSRFDNTISSAKKRTYLLCPECAMKEKQGNTSKAEKEIADYIISLGFEARVNYREKNANFEIDVFVPEKNFGIEYHGAYWHCESVLRKKNRSNPRTYHQRKAEEAEARGIDLIQVIDMEWRDKKEIIKDIIKAKLGKIENRVYARKCKVVIPDSKQANEFFENNHIFGSLRGSKTIGLEYENKLVAVLAYHPEQNGVNITRYANLLDYSVVGGFSKLLKRLVEMFSVKEIYTYADRRFSQGKLYEKTGFKATNRSKPSYWYFHLTKRDKLYNRRLFQKKYLAKKWDDFDWEKTEYENAISHRYDRIWDAGHIKYIKMSHRSKS